LILSHSIAITTFGTQDWKRPGDEDKWGKEKKKSSRKRVSSSMKAGGGKKSKSDKKK